MKNPQGGRVGGVSGVRPRGWAVSETRLRRGERGGSGVESAGRAGGTARDPRERMSETRLRRGERGGSGVESAGRTGGTARDPRERMAGATRGERLDHARMREQPCWLTTRARRSRNPPLSANASPYLPSPAERCLVSCQATESSPSLGNRVPDPPGGGGWFRRTEGGRGVRACLPPSSQSSRPLSRSHDHRSSTLARRRTPSRPGPTRSAWSSMAPSALRRARGAPSRPDLRPRRPNSPRSPDGCGHDAATNSANAAMNSDSNLRTFSSTRWPSSSNACPAPAT